MKIELRKRHLGVHRHIWTIDVAGEFLDYAKPVDGDNRFAIDEARLLAAIPVGFLPVESKQILLSVGDGSHGTGQSGLSLFRNWAKYFDSYSLLMMTGA